MGVLAAFRKFAAPKIQGQKRLTVEFPKVFTSLTDEGILIGGTKLLIISIGATPISAPLSSVILFLHEFTVTNIFGADPSEIDEGSIINDGVPRTTESN